MAVTHSKVTVVSDGADSSQVRPSDWNDDHTIATVVPSAADTYDLGAAGTAWDKVYANSVVTNGITVNTGFTITGAGSSFPGGPATNDHFFRTDVRGGMWFYYDGTYWLSTQQFSMHWSSPSAASVTAVWSSLSLPKDYDVMLIYRRLQVMPTGPYTTGAYYTLSFERTTTFIQSSTAIWTGSWSGQSESGADYIDVSEGSASVVLNTATVPATYAGFLARMTKTGSPPNTWASVLVDYRLLAT